ncbi:hypothetical protein E4U43_000392 [Claviceps pusilla]|uniref:Uncharacterized protein n=1 Tax=Claviceps pusilla TaxID=123648 RepID=A0A9P7NC00_9HYPO|nr:hypothetical protein E4U43_000392 [Claviceps pusilla]
MASAYTLACSCMYRVPALPASLPPGQRRPVQAPQRENFLSNGSNGPSAVFNPQPWSRQVKSALRVRVPFLQQTLKAIIEHRAKPRSLAHHHHPPPPTNATTHLASSWAKQHPPRPPRI